MFEAPRYKVDRPIYNLEELSHDYVEEEKKFNLLKKLDYRTKIKGITFLSVLQFICPLPFDLSTFYTYQSFFYDVLAGATLLVSHIPQGMAYGILAGLQPANGLYTSFFAPLVYAFFGSSRHLSVGTFSIITLVSSVPVLTLTKIPIIKNDTINGTLIDLIKYEEDKVRMSVSITLLASIIQLLMGFLRLGWIMNYVNDALIGGFGTATSFHVIVSQLDQILGYPIRRYSGLGELPYKVFLYFSSIQNIHWITFGISCGCMLILVFFTEVIAPLFKRISSIPLPIQLMLIILGTIASYYGKLNKRFNIKIVGHVPNGLPLPMIPEVSLWRKVFIDALMLGIFGFILTSALVKIYALRFSYDVNYNRELIAYGLSNMVGSFFRCIISAGAMGRSAVAIEAGMKSQVASLISCVLMVIVLMFLGPLFEHLPKCVLSSIIIISLKSILFQAKNVPELYRVSKYDFSIWIFSFLATIFFNVPLGLIAGLFFSLFTVYLRFHNPKTQVLGVLPDTNIYKNIKTYEQAEEIPGIKIFRYDTPIFFGNADHFKVKLFKKLKVNIKKLLSENSEIKKESKYEKMGLLDKNDYTKIEPYGQDVKFIIIDFSCINYIDNVAVRILMGIYESCKEVGIWVFFAEPNHRVQKMLQKSNFPGDKLNKIMFVSIHDAVLRAKYKMMGTDKITF